MPYYTIKSLKTLQIIPAILHSTYHAMLISEVKALLDEPKIDLQQLLIAFTDPSAKMDYNNLKLSQLGAAFINFAITLIVYCSYPKASESELHNRRVHILKNSIIFYNEYIYELSSYINTTSQNSVNSYYQSILNNMTNRQDIKLMQRSSESTLTKNIKAIVGACVNTQGIDKEELGFNIMGKLMYTILTEYKDFKKVCKNELRSGDISDLKSQIDSVECIIGYKFTNKHLLIQALTHKSYISKITDSYERLEFLGDKVLEYMLCQYLYNNYGELSPKNFAKIKQICATNKVLFELCIKSGLNEYIISDISMSKRLKKSLSNTKYQQITHKYNKVCSDIIESITGALFIDSEFNNNTVYKFIDKLLGPIINQYVAYEHGSEYTNQALNRLKLSKCKKCNVIFDLVKNSEIPEIKSRTRYIIHNKVVSESQCDCSAESSYKAALSFIDQINANNRLITELCNC
ncbi:ribonuclease III [Conidiobolus coronatus NRRL 28638]|uniref:Ribonuclease III n=1 Tax=Conidiobolus coronatus (strain ATCC 28846 / CBS 209.66 / NRRL 28638) TaxID=796925 RepID=A0A137NTX2_CONC2|nr:ribonuclease III [Conidiobolus coronatus NRRL 28638]|eukprot:KXN66243.1 ribonuclease III [Conidiobolus coronatus NRRL 28638]